MPDIKVEAIPALSDNYIWLIRGSVNGCAIVDPGEPAPVERVLESTGLDLQYVLLTHHHPDHVGGSAELAGRHDAEVFGPDDARIDRVDHVVREGDRAELPRLGLAFDVLEVPGHTKSHVVFHGHGCLFCGDTLFSVGCGRLFEGTPEQMQVSLDKLAALPPDTGVYCGHEYTLANCRFALEVEPDNEELQRKKRAVEAARERGEVTLPGRIGEELQVNPFMRTRVDSVVAAARRRDPGAVPGSATLAVIRQWKDRW